jgi:carboxyl-terminal processing protease
MRTRRLLTIALVVALAALLAAPALPRADAASAEFVLLALSQLQEHYVDPVRGAPLLNAALAALGDKLHLPPPGGLIPEAASDQEAAALFARKFDQLLVQAGGEPRATELAFAAVASMLESLHDSHTGFIPPPLYQETKRREGGEAAFTGIGIVLLRREGQFYVSEVFPGGPADLAGIRPFDRVIAVDGVSTAGLPEDQVSAMIRGPAGTSVALSLARPGEATPLTLTVVRGPIRVPALTSRMLGGGIGYVKLYEFLPGVGSAFRQALGTLQRQGMRGLVLDLRGNPGGLVDELRDVASALLPSTTPVLRMRTRGGGEVVLSTFDAPVLGRGVPLVAVVDEGTGSAAELLAAALKEQHRGLVLGTRTAGAVEVGITVDLPEGAGMSITVARVLSGEGQRLEGAGVTPDASEALTTAAMDQGRDSQLDRALDVLHTTLGLSQGVLPPGR